MSSRTKRIGDIGHYSIISQLIKYDEIIVSQPIGDNTSYDIVVDICGHLYRVQIKTTEFCKNGLMVFEVNRTNPFNRTTKLYTSDDVDLFMLYCIENDYSGLVSINEYTSKEIKIRKELPNSHYYKNVRLMKDYELNMRLLQLIKDGCLTHVVNHSS